MNADHALLLEALHHAAGPALLVADENCLGFPFHRLPGSVEVLSNRFDVAEQARAATPETRFSDFDFSDLRSDRLTLVAARLSKEKAVVHHIANSASRVLDDGGRLVLVGGKREGIKGYANRIGEAWGDGRGSLHKEGALYAAQCTRRCAPTAVLADNDYPRLRTVDTPGPDPVYSKPGIFGWDRVDPGSRLLADELPAFLAGGNRGARLLDLGCGYGYLSLMAAKEGRLAITATDNNAAALAACRRNFEVHGIGGQVVAADAGAGLGSVFDLLLCNPPFHQGFRGDRALTEKFLDAARALLVPRGRALFVVNAFVPLEKLARDRFDSVTVVRENRSYKVVALTR